MAQTSENEFGLTDLQVRFCEEYILDYNGTKAAKRAGYADGASLRVQATRLLANDNVISYLSHLEDLRAKENEYTAKRLINSMFELATMDITDVIDENGMVKKLSEIPIHLRKFIQGIKNGREGVEVKFMDKWKAYDKLMQMAGIENVSRIKVEHSYAEMSDEELVAEIEKKRKELE